MIQEYNGSTWQGKAYSKIVNTTQQVASFPVVVRPMENTIPSWTIMGNMVQDGTPSSSNIIYPSECGERTSNLFDGTLLGGYYTGANFNTSGDELVYKSIKVYLTAGTYIFSFGKNINVVRLIIDGSYSQTVATDINTYTITSTTDGYVGISFRDTTSSSTAWDNTTPIMLNTGSTALPYQPYGYKLDIKSGNTTTPVYFGQVQSTRKIKKYEFTGNESWTKVGNVTAFYTSIDEAIDKGIGYVISSHYEPSMTGANGTIRIANSKVEVLIYDNYSTVTDFKTYLQQQYSAGTPVTVWYVLAEPTTNTLNEPLRKIGTYSDSVSGTNLSVTTHSPTTIDVDTSLKPSEMDLTYTGLKMCKRKKRVNGAWV